MVIALPSLAPHTVTSKIGRGVARTNASSSFAAETEAFTAAGVMFSSTWSISPFTDSFFFELRPWTLKEPTVHTGFRSTSQSRRASSLWAKEKESTEKLSSSSAALARQQGQLALV